MGCNPGAGLKGDRLERLSYGRVFARGKDRWKDTRRVFATGKGQVESLSYGGMVKRTTGHSL